MVFAKQTTTAKGRIPIRLDTHSYYRNCGLLHDALDASDLEIIQGVNHERH